MVYVSIVDSRLLKGLWTLQGGITAALYVTHVTYVTYIAGVIVGTVDLNKLYGFRRGHGLMGNVLRKCQKFARQVGVFWTWKEC